MDKQTFEQAYNKAVDLHRCGQTDTALAAIDRLLTAAENDEQRRICNNEQKNLRARLS
jgi:hypothetical protein